MGRSSKSLTAFLDGFTLSGLFGFAKLPGGAEALVEETTDLRRSQFADLFLPLSKVDTNPAGRLHTSVGSGFARSISARTSEYDRAVESFDIDEQVVAFLKRRGLPAEAAAVRRFEVQVLTRAIDGSGKQAGEPSHKENFA